MKRAEHVVRMGEIRSVLVANREEKKHLLDLVIDGRTILKRISKQWSMRVPTELM
jgi:hypothetical protein